MSDAKESWLQDIIDFTEGLAYCSCCEGVYSCLDDCTIEVDSQTCSEGRKRYENMMAAREILNKSRKDVETMELKDPMHCDYQPEMLTVRKDYIFAAIKSIELGIEYASMCLEDHLVNVGKTNLKAKVWAERMELDIGNMKKTLAEMKECRDNR